MSFSKEMKRLRLSAFLTQEEFAKKLGVTAVTVARWESGKTTPSLKAMRKIDAFCKENEMDFDIRKTTVQEDDPS